MRVVVETYVMATGKLESTKVVDHDDRYDRQWMGKHCFWAFRNGRGVQTYAETDRRPLEDPPAVTLHIEPVTEERVREMRRALAKEG